MLTRQEVFDKVYSYFLFEDKPFSIEYNVCLYRGPNGEKCAFGIFIPDDLYHGGLEGRPANIILEKFAPELNLNPEDGQFFSELQKCHDYAALLPAEYVYKKGPLRFSLELLASKYNLEIPSGFDGS